MNYMYRYTYIRVTVSSYLLILLLIAKPQSTPYLSSFFLLMRRSKGNKNVNAEIAQIRIASLHAMISAAQRRSVESKCQEERISSLRLVSRATRKRPVKRKNQHRTRKSTCRPLALFSFLTNLFLFIKAEKLVHSSCDQ